ncbi:dTDP-4-dehydrorhamnose 3,5-epimerase [Methylococcus capsulatus]|uniref:dTDP-4-dehydrorhamnose 3,5-epimerase n=1 Tax=Methylococcus capsulatus TaxID=414 RepID=A0AA35XWX2_METCP|nr:dTDP-4-dehydrorhamnose 3,5-epimerase [Methylococcus capsulatus]QXP87997.1 dTDP-4-dehydrorhamnose 3,5-epimerase [Methylococcus capsulatus]QXP94990.1 dTDP-4-dehydrorhamnose 3,5-epimerase [Methylococcus capsulatus]UQN13022.1 dTDP-4-dehydrorhamnose 3,5-epimerase [Methylococcus capsulatus]CAI8716152.1 dTDP-4-dehydrorhamnose 3,5-epimerase [Methylococcus capsulatus]
MNVEQTDLPGVLLISPKVFGDARGYFKETWSRQRYQDAGLPGDFVQDNLSYSRKGILRGLHFQNPRPQGKLVQVLQGEVFDVAVDIRYGSPHFGRWFGTVLSAENHLQMYVPEGFAHGFCVLSEAALFAYKCTEYYEPSSEFSLRWDDPDIGIAWPLDSAPELSAKDRDAPRLRDLPQHRLPVYP